VCVGVLRVGRDGRPECLLRAVDVLALVLDQDTQVEARVGVLRASRDRRPGASSAPSMSLRSFLSRRHRLLCASACFGPMPPPPRPCPLPHHTARTQARNGNQPVSRLPQALAAEDTQPHCRVVRYRRPQRQTCAALRARVVHTELAQPFHARLVVHTCPAPKCVEADRDSPHRRRPLLNPPRPACWYFKLNPPHKTHSTAPTPRLGSTHADSRGVGA
jgi:hypothetical protein